MRVADDIGVFENLVLKFDAIRISLRGCARTDVKDQPLAFAQDGLEIGSNWVGEMVRRDSDDFVRYEKWHFNLDFVGHATSFALQLGPSGTQFAVAGRTTDNSGNALIHSTKEVVCTIGQCPLTLSGLL